MSFAFSLEDKIRVLAVGSWNMLRGFLRVFVSRVLVDINLLTEPPNQIFCGAAEICICC